MNITKSKQGSTLTVGLEGRLDTTTAPQLESELKTALDDVTELIFDIKDLAYISSAGLRVLLGLAQVMEDQGKMVVTNPNDAVMDVFSVTGFDDILTIE